VPGFYLFTRARDMANIQAWLQDQKAVNCCKAGPDTLSGNGMIRAYSGSVCGDNAWVNQPDDRFVVITGNAA